jgi:4'-phosphopantetheinyl transferase
MSVLHCSSIDPVRFLKPTPDIFLPDNTIQVWKFPVIETNGSLLSEPEIAQAARFRQGSDKSRFTTGRQMLRLLSSRYLCVPPEEIIVIGGRHQKPVIGNKNKRPLHFNLSHSGEWVLLAFSDSPLGIDIEEIKSLFSFRDIVQDQFSESERDFVFNSPDPVCTFYLLWTRKEALLKGWGSGLQQDLRVIPSLDGRHTLIPEYSSWQLNSFRVEDHYQAAIAFTNQPQAVSYFDGSYLII